MYLDDFRALIRRVKKPNAEITYYQGAPNRISIFDRNYLRRRPDEIALTGHYEHDHWRDCKICDMTVHNGESPMEGYTPKTDRDGKLIGEPQRGVLATLTILMNEGCLQEDNDELRDLFRIWNRRLPKPAPSPSRLANNLGHCLNL